MNWHLFESTCNLLIMSHANVKWWIMGLFYILHQQEMRHKYVGGTNHRFSALHTCVNIRKRMSFMAWDSAFGLPYSWDTYGIPTAHKAAFLWRVSRPGWLIHLRLLNPGSG